MSVLFDPGSLLLLAGAAFIFIFIIHGLYFANRPQSRKLNRNNAEDAELAKAEHVGKVRIVSFDRGAEILQADKDSTNNNTASRKGHIVYGADKAPARAERSIQDTQIPEETYDSLPESYELIVAAKEGSLYHGKDIELICREYGFLPAMIRNTMKIYAVYENADSKENEVFRICSMEPPYYFPEDNADFTTSAIVLYMSLPPKGKGYAYFKALRLASDIFVQRLGGGIYDNKRRPVSIAALNRMADALVQYDKEA